MEAYSDFARVYDIFMDNVEYEKELRQKLSKLNKTRQKYMDMYADDLITRQELNDRIGGMKEEIARIENDLKLVSFNIDKGEQLEGIIKKTFDTIESITDVRQLTNAQLKQVIQKIEVDQEGNVDIYLRLLGDLGLDETVLISDNRTFGGNIIMMNQTLGSRIAELRRKKNMTQEELAAELGVTPQAVSKWENDLSCPDITLLPQLARLFDVTTDELLGNTGHPETTLLPKEERKPIKDMILRVVFNSKAGDKVRVNLPMTLVEVGLQMGMQMPQVTGGSAAEAMKSIDIEQIFKLVEQGVIGKLVEVESADGDTVEVFVE